MPELPEVETTVRGLQTEVVGARIVDVWTDYRSALPMHAQEIKNPAYWDFFRETVVGATIIGARRRAKLVLIDLSNGYTIQTHMKMTGHYVVGNYGHDTHKNMWAPVASSADSALASDGFNRWIHVVFTLKGAAKFQHLALSDLRKFAKVQVLPTTELNTQLETQFGPEPLARDFSQTKFLTLFEHNTRRKMPIKQLLMDPAFIAGIGNIYSDELLWLAGIHPRSATGAIPVAELKKAYTAAREVLARGIDFGGDSMSDYRNIYGERGQFQAKHNAYRHTGKPCSKRGCDGIIAREMIGARSAHYCPVHQKLFSVDRI